DPKNRKPGRAGPRFNPGVKGNSMHQQHRASQKSERASRRKALFRQRADLRWFSGPPPPGSSNPKGEIMPELHHSEAPCPAPIRAAGTRRITLTMRAEIDKADRFI